MQWNFEEAIVYYKKLGAPKDQSALISLLKEIQQEHGNSIPGYMVKWIAEAYEIKESFLFAIPFPLESVKVATTYVELDR